MDEGGREGQEIRMGREEGGGCKGQREGERTGKRKGLGQGEGDGKESGCGEDEES